MLGDHNRNKIVSEFQHLYEHALSEMAYSHPALPQAITDAELAMNYVMDVLYPRTQPSGLGTMDLPTALNVPHAGDVAPTINDQRLVQRDDVDILPLSVNSNLVAGVLEIASVVNIVVSNTTKLGNIGNDLTFGFPDTFLYVGAINVPLSTVTLFEDTSLLVPADLSGLGLIAGTHFIAADVTAMYNYIQFDGQATPQWNLMAKLGFGANNVVQAMIDQTQYLYTRKFGITDYDPLTQAAYVGVDAGQHFYGGEAAGQHMTLHASNAGTPVVNTEFIQFADSVRPNADLTYDAGQAAQRFNNIYAGTLLVGSGGATTMTIGSGSITDTTGTIDFDNENLTTTGNINGAIITASDSLVVDNGAGSVLTLDNGLITDSTGTISFDNENLVTTGTITGRGLVSDNVGADTITILPGSIIDSTGLIDFDNENLTTTGIVTAGSFVGLGGTFGDITVGVLTDNTISTLTIASNLTISTFDVAGEVIFNRDLQTIGISTVGIIDVTGSLIVDNLTLDAQGIVSSTGTIDIVNSHLIPTIDTTRNLGSAALRWGSVYLNTSGLISDGTEQFTVSELMDLRSANYRDAARTTPAQAGDILCYTDIGAGVFQWIASTKAVQTIKIVRDNTAGVGTGILDPAGFDVSAAIDDARDAIWQISENGSAFEIMQLSITKSATHVFVSTLIDLPAGNYTLLGMEI